MIIPLLKKEPSQEVKNKYRYRRRRSDFSALSLPKQSKNHVNFDLPRDLRLIASIVGREKAINLAGKLLTRSGYKVVSLYIPKRITKDHKLIELVGENDAKALVDNLGGEILYIENCLRSLVMRFRNRAIERLSLDGVSNKTIAFLFDLTPRQIKNIIKR
jgi:hypothetical protein